ncbi:aldo/keto reductase [Paenibacillus psychroresistens]|uniref:Aldo/keto reductase n=1 Tax=Paenibacillus psychroresistens TaxID=1778678 RepID=A0A6B8RHK6_9BACL|nr:aldo/keto reductase [Paenibacillus psychroresistens]QGQ95085.1 aldo/keto reductase [Paenibacillus psychroresistens]
MKYYLLGKSGLRVSELSLGTMTFGTEAGWGTDMNEAQKILDLYTDRGGNFVDTANVYMNGSSEKMLGNLLADKRNQIVLSTKYTMNAHPGDPNGGGNHRKSMVRSVEESLKRLKTDYIDLLYMHIWDDTTPVEEILRTMDDLVRSGKVLYVGISDTPAWQVARMQAIADLRGWSPLVALQIEYSLIERTSERELIPMANDMGLGVVPWSPLGSGLLSGKYTREDFQYSVDSAEIKGTKKAGIITQGKFTERNMTIVEEVNQIASEINKLPAQVALAWLLSKKTVTSITLGVRSVEQLENNLGSLEVNLSSDQIKRLDEASRIDLGFPHETLANPVNKKYITGGIEVLRR